MVTSPAPRSARTVKRRCSSRPREKANTWLGKGTKLRSRRCTAWARPCPARQLRISFASIAISWVGTNVQEFKRTGAVPQISACAGSSPLRAPMHTDEPEAPSDFNPDLHLTFLPPLATRVVKRQRGGFCRGGGLLLCGCRVMWHGGSTPGAPRPIWDVHFAP